jgi:hypothetical protein
LTHVDLIYVDAERPSRPDDLLYFLSASLSAPFLCQQAPPCDLVLSVVIMAAIAVPVNATTGFQEPDGRAAVTA